jgi:hypothetical protein
MCLTVVCFTGATVFAGENAPCVRLHCFRVQGNGKWSLQKPCPSKGKGASMQCLVD